MYKNATSPLHDPYEKFYANPFLPMTFPTKEVLLNKGWPLDEIAAFQIAASEEMDRRDRWVEGKPPGELARKFAEDQFYESRAEPFRRTFRPDDVADGVTYRRYLEIISITFRRLVGLIADDTGYAPTCALVSPEIAHLVQTGLGVYFKASLDDVDDVVLGDWRRCIGRIFDAIDLHIEPDCRVPYLLPRGEVWLLLAWRYDDHIARQTQWARPVGVLRFEGYTDSEMVHIAKCAR